MYLKFAFFSQGKQTLGLPKANSAVYQCGPSRLAIDFSNKIKTDVEERAQR